MSKKINAPADPIAKVNKICEAILKLTENDFKAVENMANEQLAYNHPLKYATAAKFNNLGTHNIQVLKGLKELHSTISSLKK